MTEPPLARPIVVYSIPQMTPACAVCSPKTKVTEIAVGTIIADRPPRGPGRALISASGSYRG